MYFRMYKRIIMLREGIKYKMLFFCCKYPFLLVLGTISAESLIILLSPLDPSFNGAIESFDGSSAKRGKERGFVSTSVS